MSSEKKEASRINGRESKAKRRAGMSDETKENSRKKKRESDAKRRAGMTDEQRQVAKQKRHKLYLDKRKKVEDIPTSLVPSMQPSSLIKGHSMRMDLIKLLFALCAMK